MMIDSSRINSRRSLVVLLSFLFFFAVIIQPVALCQTGQIELSSDVEISVEPAFTGLLMEPYVGPGWIEHGYTGFSTVRLYATFADPLISSPLIGITGVYGFPGHALTVRVNGGVFYNDETVDSLTAPINYTGYGIWSNQWDTYVTIGTDEGIGDGTKLSPGFGVETNGLQTNFSTTNALWYWMDWNQGWGQGYPINGRVLLAQFTMSQENAIYGECNILFLDESNAYDLAFWWSPAGPGDVNLDGVVDILDLLSVVGNWDETGSSGWIP